MAIQTRQGIYEDFDPGKMLPGEWGCVRNGDPNAKDGRAVYMAFEAGAVKRMATYDDMTDNVEKAFSEVEEEIRNQFIGEIEDAVESANTATKSMLNLEASVSAEEKKRVSAETERQTASAEAVKNANEAAERANEAAGNIEGVVAETSTVLSNSAPGGLKLNSIKGSSEQDGTPSPDNPVNIQSVEISEIKTIGKNLLNPTLETTASNGVTVTKTSEGMYVVNGTPTADTSFRLAENKKIGELLNNFNGQSLKFVCADNSTVKANIYVKTASEEFNNFAQSKSGVIINVPRDTVEEANCTMNLINGTTYNNIVIKPVITTALETTYDTYEPYQESAITLSSPATLRGIGDVKDEICKRDDVYGVLRRVNEVVLDGSETWSLESINSYGIANFSRTVSDYNNNKINNHMCDRFQTQVSLIGNTTGEGSYFNTSKILFIRINQERASTVADFKTWLSSNNVTVDYILSNPIFEPLPDADQIALRSLETFDIVTHILTDSAIEPGFETEYGVSVAGGYSLKATNDVDIAQIEVTRAQASAETAQETAETVQTVVDCSTLSLSFQKYIESSTSAQGFKKAMIFADKLGTLLVGAGEGYIYHINKELVQQIRVHSTLGNTFTGATFSDNTFRLVNNNGLIFTSPDGITWTDSDVSFGDYDGVPRRIAVGYGMFVGIRCDYGEVYYSSGGETWNESGDVLADCQDVFYSYDVGRFIIVGQGIWYSDNGYEWIKVLTSSYTYRSIAYGNGKLVAVGDNGRVAVSEDKGLTWQSYYTGFSSNFYGITYARGMFLAVFGNSSGVLCSPDATEGSWETLSTSGGSGAADIIYADGNLYTMGFSYPLNLYRSHYPIYDESGERKSFKTVFLRATLPAGETRISFYSDAIKGAYSYEFYTSIYGVNPKSAEVDNNTLRILTLTFDAQETDMEVGVRIDV